MTTPRSSFVVSPKRAVQCAVLTFAALAAPRVVAEVILNGVEGPASDNVLAYIDLDQEPCDAPERRVRQLYQAAREDALAALQAVGYYAPRIASELAFDPDCWRATFTIELGEPVLIRTLDVAVVGEGADDVAFVAAQAESGLAVGAPLNHGSYERLKRRWLDIAAERGYAEGRLAANHIDVYPDERAADITLQYESGPRYSFGPVELEQEVLRDSLVEAYLTFRPGDTYDNAALTQLYVDLAESGYFQVIDVRPLQPDSATRQIPIRIALTGAPRRLITYGIGYSTDTGARVSLSRNNRRWNDRGHMFGVEAQLSAVISQVTANYRFPFGDDPGEEWIGFDVGAKTEDTESAESTSFELGARRVVQTRNDWTRTQMLSLLVEDFDIADQSDRSRLLMPTIDWLRTPADDVIAPRWGTRLHLQVRGASDSLGSDTSFVQVLSEAKQIWLLPNDGRFLVRGQVGHTWKNELTELPASVRYFAGGDNSVRGYEFEELGPVDDTGQVIGGSSLVTASVEYEHPLRSRWALAFFFDWGNAFEGSNLDSRKSAGIGGRWLSPLGPIRIDLAHPLDDPNADDIRVHITLGPDL